MAVRRPSCKELQMIAETELNEIPSRVESDIAHIRTWLNQQSYIKARTDDSTLLLFLRACKFSLEKTKMRLEVFYTVKTAFPDIFKNRDPFLRAFEHIFENSNIVILPSHLNGPTLAMGKFDNANTDITSMVDILKICTMILEVLLKECPNTSIVGVVALIDVLCFTSNGDETVRQFFPRENFPSQYGGNAGSFSDLSDQLKKKLISYYDWFVEDEQFGCIKHEKPKYFLENADLFGLDGSFRKLEID